MQGWKVTAGLAVAALLAACVAPRLLAGFAKDASPTDAVSGPSTAIAPIVDAPSGPVVAPDRAEWTPSTPRATPRPAGVGMQQAGRPTGRIPELDARPAPVPVPIQPIEPTDWPVLTECGMG
jgi:hypothetical protein